MNFCRNIIFLILIATAFKGLFEDKQVNSDIPLAINYGKASSVFNSYADPYSGRIGSFDKSQKYASSNGTKVFIISKNRHRLRQLEPKIPKIVHTFLFSLSSVFSKEVITDRISDGLKSYIVHFMRC